MRLSTSLTLFCLTSLGVAASWGFEDAVLSTHSKTAGFTGLKEKLAQNKPLSKPVSLGATETLKVIFTLKEDGQGKRPHQAFLNLKDSKTDLETSFAFQVKENGKGKVEIGHKDLPYQLLSSSEPLTASIVIASFGSSKPYNSPAFDLSVSHDPSAPLPSQPKPLRYGKLPEINHIFKSDPTSPPKIITIIFTAAIVAALPALLITWTSLGANLNHFPHAFRNAPIPHALFFSSIVAVEAVFFMYYTSWNLFQMLPAGVGIGLVAFISGSRALSEVQERRLAGLR